MTDRGIIFSEPMVREIGHGRKKQTRRLATSPLRKCVPGDRLYVRETFWIATHYSYGTTPGSSEIAPPPLNGRRGDPVHYAADGDPPNCENRHYGKDGLKGGWFAAPDPYAVWHKTPSIHMPRWASRLTLVVTAVRVEPLQAITETDAQMEGVDKQFLVVLMRPDGGPDYRIPNSYRGGFANIWDKLHGAGAWDKNPDVVVLTFKVHPVNIDKLPGAA